MFLIKSGELQDKLVDAFAWVEEHNKPLRVIYKRTGNEVTIKPGDDFRTVERQLQLG